MLTKVQEKDWEPISPHVPFCSTIQPSSKEHKITGLLEKGIIDTDMFYPPPPDKKQKPYQDWFRYIDFIRTIVGIIEAQRSGYAQFRLRNIYDRSTRRLAFTDNFFSMPFISHLIISGLEAFRCLPILERRNISPIIIEVKAAEINSNRRYLNRDKGRRPEEEAMRLLNQQIRPHWEKVRRRVSNKKIDYEFHALPDFFHGVQIISLKKEKSSLPQTTSFSSSTI